MDGYSVHHLVCKRYWCAPSPRWANRTYDPRPCRIACNFVYTVSTPVLFDFSLQMHFQACMHVGVLRSIHVASHLTVSDTVEIKYSAAAAIFAIQTRRELAYLKRFSLLVLVRILLFVVVHAPEDSFSYLLICQSSFFGHETTYCL